MEQALFKSVSRVCSFIAVCILLAACSPKLNWRTVQSPEQRYTALFPSKPDKLERLISYQDQQLRQSLEAVKIDDDIYSISSIQIPANQSDSVQKIIDQLKSNLLDRAKSSGGSVLVEDAFYQTDSQRRLPTKDYFITFFLNDKVQQIMRVRWVMRPIEGAGVWVYQISVLQTNTDKTDARSSLSKEDYESFFNEFHPG